MRNLVICIAMSAAFVTFVPGSNGALEFLASMLGLAGKLKAKNLSDVPLIWSIVGIADPSSSCPETDIHCGSGECILKKWRCDAQVDCKDGSDEANCPPPDCKSDHFSCDGVRCLPIDYRCDGQEDCKDKSDVSRDFCLFDLLHSLDDI